MLAPFVSSGVFIYNRDRMISIGTDKICLLYFIITFKKIWCSLYEINSI